MSEIASTVSETVTNPYLGDMMLGDTLDAVHLTDLGAVVVQRLQARFHFFRGEWFLNLDEGTPWFESILVKAPSDSVIRSVLGQVITSTPGVASLSSFSYSISRDRVMSVNFVARLEDGSVLRSADSPPFVVGVA